MTEQEIEIPILYTETESIAKTADFTPKGNGVFTAGDETIYDPALKLPGKAPLAYSSDMTRGYSNFVRDSIRKPTPEQEDMLSGMDDKEHVKQTMGDINEKNATNESKMKANDLLSKKETKVPTIPKMASFDHECNIWGNNLAENREFYESIEKAGRE